MKSVSARLAGLYTAILAVTLLLVIAASSFALVLGLGSFTRDIIIARHEMARNIVSDYRAEHLTLAQAASNIVKRLSITGLRVAVYDDNDKQLAGDPAPPPHFLSRIVGGHVVRHDTFLSVVVHGGYVVFEPSSGLLMVLLVPYWRVIAIIVLIAIVISWFLGRFIAERALEPLGEITDSLNALARGDFTKRHFMSAGGEDIGALTAAFNDAVSGVNGAIEERAKTEERMRRFVADAGHELRTPLTIIGGYIDVLRRGAVEEPKIARQILGTMMLERERMRTMIDSLVRLARMDEELPPVREDIDVAELLRNQVDAVHRLDETRVMDYDVPDKMVVSADRIELGEALWNIVENAVKYAPDSAIHLRARRTDDGRAEIVISDDGPGMTEAERLHVFERFFRGDIRGEIAGSGLGLAIAKRAIERVGGSISLQSAPKRGTVVTLLL